jgi:WD40 repeat protein
LCGVWLLWGGYASAASPGSHAGNSGKGTVESHAMALLQGNCFSCHNEEKKKGGLVLTSREGLLKGGNNGPVLASSQPETSVLLKVLAAEADPHMPPKKQLSKPEINTVRRWVKAGAKWDAAALLAAEERIQPVNLRPLPSDYQPVLALALSSEGERLAVARGSQFTVYDVTSTNFAVVAKVEAHREEVQSLAWSEDGRWLASGGFRRVVLWDTKTMQPTREFTNGFVGRVTALRFSPEGSFLIVADSLVAQRGFIRVIDPGAGVLKTSWPAHDDAVLALDLNREGDRLATAGADKLAKVWDLESHKELARLEGHSGAVLGVAFNTNATQLVSAGADKELKVWDIQTREKLITLGKSAVALTAVMWLTNGNIIAANDAGAVFAYTDFKAHTGEQSSAGGKEKKIAEAGDPVLCVSASHDGKTIVAGDHSGLVKVWNGDGKLRAKLEPISTNSVEGFSLPGENAVVRAGASSVSTRPKKKKAAELPVSFVRDILPVLSKAGCNAGACHAKPEGQNGFKLSVFSYDPKSDYAEIAKEARGRRVFPAAPEESLILKKPTLGLQHEGGERFQPGSQPYELIARWIRDGMIYQVPEEATLVRIVAKPGERRYRKGAKQRLQVKAHYSDGSERDVTHLASFDSNEKEIAQVDERGQVNIGKLTGQGAIVARYMGFVADAKIMVPADRLLPASKYSGLPVNNFIDELAYAHFKELGLLPSRTCSDAEFLRRASLDAIGLLPTAAEARAFLKSGIEHRKCEIADRRALINRLLDQPAYADYWANRFADLLRPNPDRVGVKSVFIFDQWLRECFRANKPYDQFVREILTAEGSNHRDGPAVVYRDRREPADLTTMFSQLFLGVRLECARCHHHPNEKWGQEDFYQFAAFFGTVKQKGAGLSPPISAGTETFYFAAGGTVKHPVSGEVMSPRAPEAETPQVPPGTDPRQALAAWLTASNNPFFAQAIVNRVWANFFGRGLVEPVDDFRISNPSVNPPLLEALAANFAKHGYDLKHLMRTIMESHLYQLGSEPNESNLADTRNFSRAYRRRLPAEVLLDAVNDATGVRDNFAGMPIGSRATQAWSYKIESQFMDAFSRPNPSSDPPCERDRHMSVVQSLHLMNSKALQAKLSNKTGRAFRLAASTRSPDEIVTELYFATLSRPPSSEEQTLATAAFNAKDANRQTATEDVFWALLNSAEFVFNH